MGNSKSSGQTLARQAMLLAGASLVVRFIGFLYRLPVTIMIGDQGNGIYSASYNIYALFLIISSAAFPATISKLVAESDARGMYRNSYKIFRVGMVISASLGFLAMLILLIFAKPIESMLNNPGSAISIRLLAPTVFIVSILAVYRGYYQGMKDNTPTATSQVIEQVFNAVVSIGCTALFVKIAVDWAAGPIAWGAGGSSIGTGVGALTGLVYIVVLHKRRKKTLSKRAKTGSRKMLSAESIAKMIVHTAIPIVAGTAIVSIMNIVDQMMISSGLTVNFTSDEAQIMYGQYSGKYILLTTLPISVATAFAVTIIPNLAIDKENNDLEAIEHKSNMALKMTMLFCVPSAIGLTVLAEPILMLLFRSEYQGAELLRYGSIAIIFTAFSQMTIGVLQGLSYLYLPLVSVLIGACVKLPLNYFLIRIESINIIGAVISTIVFYLLTAIINYVFLKRNFPIKLDLMGVFVKPFVSAIVMGLICYGTHTVLMHFFGNNDFATIMAILLGASGYFGIMFITGGLDKDILRRIPVVKNYI